MSEISVDIFFFISAINANAVIYRNHYLYALTQNWITE